MNPGRKHLWMTCQAGYPQAFLLQAVQQATAHITCGTRHHHPPIRSLFTHATPIRSAADL